MKEINLVEILKECPSDTTLYSPILGDVQFEIEDIGDESEEMIVISISSSYNEITLNVDGRYCDEGELMLFPSKDNRDWTTFKAPIKVIERFDPKTLKPYDKVLGRDNRNFMWDATFFSHIDKESLYPLRTVSGGYKQLIPFKGNEHLVGKVGEPDEHYCYWEEEEDGQTAST